MRSLLTAKRARRNDLRAVDENWRRPSEKNQRLAESEELRLATRAWGPARSGIREKSDPDLGRVHGHNTITRRVAEFVRIPIRGVQIGTLTSSATEVGIRKKLAAANPTATEYQRSLQNAHAGRAAGAFYNWACVMGVTERQQRIRDCWIERAYAGEIPTGKIVKGKSCLAELNQARARGSRHAHSGLCRLGAGNSASLCPRGW